MPIKKTIDVTKTDLKTIIHGLKMMSLSFVEENAIDEIQLMIKFLPSPEEIEKFYPENIKKTQNDVGNIMRLIELYGKRDREFKTRYKSRTGLPPRYKVLGRKNMEQKAREFIRELVKLSEVADSKGNGEIAGKLIKCAKKIQSKEIQEQDIDDIIISLEKTELIKEAQFKNLRRFWEGVKNVGKGVAQNYAEGVRKRILEEINVDMANVGTILQKINKKIVDSYNKLPEDVSPDFKKQIEKLYQEVNYMIQIGAHEYKVVNELKEDVDLELAGAEFLSPEQKTETTRQENKPLVEPIVAVKDETELAQNKPISSKQKAINFLNRLSEEQLKKILPVLSGQRIINPAFVKTLLDHGKKNDIINSIIKYVKADDILRVISKQFAIANNKLRLHKIAKI